MGYAPLYGDTAASIDEALRNGLDALRIGSSVRVSAEYLQEVLTDGSVAFRGEQYFEDTLGAAREGFALDTAIVGRMVVVFVATHKEPLARTRGRFERTAPDWITTTPQTAIGVYAVGATAVHYNEHEAWLDAERHARRNLAFSAITALRSTMESRTGGTSEGALIATTAAEIRDLRVRERWRDAGRIFVLVQGHIMKAGGE